MRYKNIDLQYRTTKKMHGSPGVRDEAVKILQLSVLDWNVPGN